MKNIFCIISFLILSNILYSQNQPTQVLYTGEVYITLKNFSSTYFVDFTVSPLDNTRWDENRNLTTNYGGYQSGSLTYINQKTHLNIDLVTSQNGSGIVVGLGYYRIETDQGAYVDVDWRTSTLAENVAYGSPDLILEYDVTNNCFTWPNSSTSINSSILKVWEWSNYPESKNNLEPYPPINLTVNEKDENYPILNWTHNTTGNINRTGYSVYRCITTNSDDVPTDFMLIATLDANCITYSDQQVAFGNWDYAHYRVKAINGDRESKFSEEADASLIRLLNKKNIEATNTVYSNEIFQNFPNPFNPITDIYYSVKSNSLVRLQVFDVLGNKVADLINEIKPTGEYRASFNGSSLPSGMYICKIQIGSYIGTIKMLLMK